ncbi:hypothetical protein T484DRAFT_1868379 [Baffinella frigidus]|nr:hypothetical protein T484DRAFT_1868379 [Cryptophyta sp. CCMP2293]
MCTLLASLLLANVPGTLAQTANFANAIPTVDTTFVSMWSLIMTIITVSSMTNLIGVGYQLALVFVPSWAYHTDNAAATGNITSDVAILLLIATAISALTLSPFVIHRCHKITALYRLMRLGTTIGVMTAIGAAVLVPL